MSRDFTVAEALDIQRAGCVLGGSVLYAGLLDAIGRDYQAGGLMAELLDGRTDRPLHDALGLRLLGAVHRIVLEGRAPELARFYPSVGGHDSGDPTDAFFATVVAHRAEVERGLDKGVQTNEVGRAAVLAPGFALIARRAALPLRLREVGSSAGLLLRWDHYRYVADGVELGDPTSPLVFDDAWIEPVPDLSGSPVVTDRRGCDIAPIDAGSADGRLSLLSFVWADQEDRIERLRLALDIAAAHPAVVDRADAGDWLESQLAADASGQVTVVFHSIVIQYLPEASRQRLRAVLEDTGERATRDNPLAWLRMEPAGANADLRLTWWPGGEEVVLATTGYHGREIRWTGGRD